MENKKTNLYLDDLARITTGAHGADISSQRQDALDHAAYEAVELLIRARKESGQPTYVLTIGGGFGTMEAKFAALGAQVVMVEILDIEQHIASVNALLQQNGLAGHVTLVQKDIRDFDPVADLQSLIRQYNHSDAQPLRFDIIHSQRFIHYLPFSQALRVLQKSAQYSSDDCELYLSASGLGTELSKGYMAKDEPIENRHAKLAINMAEKHGIFEPVALYSRQDMQSLLKQAGFHAKDVTCSAFGNVKAIAHYSYADKYRDLSQKTEPFQSVKPQTCTPKP